MKKNQNPNFLDSASSYWSSKFCSSAPKQVRSSPEPLPIAPSLSQPLYSPSVMNPQFYTQPAIYPQSLQAFPSNGAYFLPSPAYAHVSPFQNLVSPGLMPGGMNILSPQEFQPRFGQPQPGYFVPTRAPQEGLFGTVLQKASNFWRCSPANSISVTDPRTLRSDPMSNAASNRSSELLSWERREELPAATQIGPKKRIRKDRRKTKKQANQASQDSVSVAKKLLAIASNWSEVCKKIPEGMQSSFKEKMKRYLRRKILPDLQLKNRLQRVIQGKPDFPIEISDMNNFNLVDHENVSTNPNLDEPHAEPNADMLKFDEIFGRDMDHLLHVAEDEEAKNEDPGPQNELPPWMTELESPTFSKLLRPDNLSVNFNFENSEFPPARDRGPGGLADMDLADAMISERKPLG